MKRHLPRGRWTPELLESLSWRKLAGLARYPYRRSKARAKKRIHKLERAAAGREIRKRSQ